jgi:hypothetical protein
MNKSNKWFKAFLGCFFPSSKVQRKLLAKSSMYFGSEFIELVRTCDVILADKMQKVEDAYVEMYAYVAYIGAKQNDNKDVI